MPPRNSPRGYSWITGVLFLNCKEFEKKIPDFTKDHLDDNDLQSFLAHYRTCSACREELSIRMLVFEGLPRLESGKTFHLQQEMDRLVKEESAHLIRRRRLEKMAYGMEILTIGLVLLCGIFMLLV